MKRGVSSILCKICGVAVSLSRENLTLFCENGAILCTFTSIICLLPFAVFTKMYPSNGGGGIHHCPYSYTLVTCQSWQLERRADPNYFVPLLVRCSVIADERRRLCETVGLACSRDQRTRDGTGSATLTRDPTRDASDP